MTDISGSNVIAGFDVGGTYARAGLYEMPEGLQIQTSRKRIRSLLEPDEVAEAIAQLLVELSDDSDIALDDIAGVGIAVAAQLDADRRVIRNAPNLGWTDVPFAKQMRAALTIDVPLLLLNDLNGQLIGELEHSNLANCGDVLAVYVGTGVGGAMLMDGELQHGGSGVAGEIGHVKVAPGGRLCGCGQRGCLEAYAGGLALEKQLGRRLKEQRDLTLRSDEIQLSDFDADVPGDDVIGGLWDEATDYLAVSIANACTLLNPQALLLGGGVVENLPNFREQLYGKIPGLVSETARTDLRIEDPQIGENAGMLGAARYVYSS